MKSKIVVLIAFFSILSSAYGQKNSPWEKWDWLFGDWTGEGSGQPGQGGGTFSFKTDLNQKILVRKSHSEYPAVGTKPQIVHDDLLIVYPDYSGIPVNAIYFDNEGHTINYSITYGDKKITFTSNKIPNVPVFRLTYEQLDEAKVNTKFEISPDGEKFNLYIEGNSSKVH